jgi:hypothetical protein
MSETQTNDPYAIVLADLREQRAKIDQAISAIESLRGIAPSGRAASQPETPKSSTGAGGGSDGPGAFLGLTIVDAAKKLLMSERRQLTNSEIVQAFGRGGLILNSEDKLNTVGSVLNRRFLQVGDVVRVGRGTWGLKEWYPNRSFKSAKQVDVKTDGEPAPDPVADFAGVQIPSVQVDWDLDKGAGNS